MRIIYLEQKSFHFHNNDVMKMTVIVDDARIRRKRINMSSDSGSWACAHLLLPLSVVLLVNSRKSLPHVGASGSSPENSFDEIYLRIIYLEQKSFHFHNNDVMKMTVIVDDARIRRKRINMSSDSGSRACAHLLLPLSVVLLSSLSRRRIHQTRPASLHQGD